MLIVPGVIAIALLVWRDGPSWLIWTVSGSFIVTWLVWQSYRTTLHDLRKEMPQSERTDAERVHLFWQKLAGVVVWAYWLICAAAVLVVFLV